MCILMHGNVFNIPEKGGNMEIPIIAILSVFGLLPAIVFTFIYKLKKAKSELEALKYKKEILELELLKDEKKIIRLEAENRKLDRVLDNN